MIVLLMEKQKTEIATALKNASSEWETDLSKGRGYGTGEIQIYHF